MNYSEDQNVLIDNNLVLNVIFILTLSGSLRNDSLSTCVIIRELEVPDPPRRG